MVVQLSDNCHWLNECYAVGQKHLHICSYLLDCNTSKILIDTGSFYHRERLTKQIKDVVGDDELDTIIISQPDLLHSGNVWALLDEIGGDVVCFTGAPELHGYSDVQTESTGSRRLIGGQTFEFIDPLLADVASTAWVYDYESKRLFTSDAFGHFHNPSECASFVGPVERYEAGMYELAKLMLRWLEYVDPEKLAGEILRIFDEYDVDSIHPVHGHPIPKEYVEPYVEMFLNVVENIASEYDCQAST